MVATEMSKAKQFCRDNLKQCCAEMVKWDDSGILGDGKLRELANLCAFAEHSDLAVAKAIVTTEAIAFVANLPDQAFSAAAK